MDSDPNQRHPHSVKVMTLEEAQAKLDRWEAYREEMQGMEVRQAKIAADFLELGAYSDAARCAIMAEGMKFVVGRMPPKD